MKLKRKIYLLGVLLATLLTVQILDAGVLGPLIRFYPGDPRTPSSFNTNWTAIENSVNNIVAAQISANAVTTTKILNAAVTAAKIATGVITDAHHECTGMWDTLSLCDSVVDNADTQHVHALSTMTGTVPAASVTLADAGGYYATDTTESALQDLAIFTGYSSGGLASTTYALRYLGFVSSPTTITVPPGTAPNGILALLSGTIQAGAASGLTCGVHLPLKVNGVNLSTSLGVDHKFIIGMDISNASVISNASRAIIYLPSDGWDNSISNTVEIGTEYQVVGSTCTSATATNKFMILQGLK